MDVHQKKIYLEKENVAEVTQGVTRFLLIKVAHVKCHTNLNKLKIALI